jgi:hypothetical protein
MLLEMPIGPSSKAAIQQCISATAFCIAHCPSAHCAPPTSTRERAILVNIPEIGNLLQIKATALR